MPTQFVKTKDCGCCIKAISCGIKNTPNGKMYMLGGHSYLMVCSSCKKMTDSGKKTLYDMWYDMWMNDNLTNDCMYAEWKQYDATQSAH